MKTGQKLYLACMFSGALIAACQKTKAPAGAGGGGVGGAGGGGAPAAETRLRIAHLSPDARRVDVCLLRDGDSLGPVLSSLLGERNGLDYGEVSSYFPVSAGTYTIRLVEPGGSGCDAALQGMPDVTGVELTGGAHHTLAALGQVTSGAATPFQVKAFTDDVEPTRGKTKLRFLHAAPGAPEVDVGLGSGADFRPLFTGVKFGDAGTEAGKEYREIAPPTSATLVLRKAGAASELLALRGLSLRADEVATAFAIGDPAIPTRPLQGLVCIDSEATRAKLSQCTRLTP